MAAASGSPTLTVQWQVSVNGGAFTDIPEATTATYSFTGATTANFTITSPVASDAGKYRVIVSNTGRKVTSQLTTLTITATNW
jgi:hypothetical protein